MKYFPVLLAGVLLATSGWAQAQSPDSLQVRSMAAACAGCHGTNGRAQPGQAVLAGVSQAVLLRKLLDFKSGAQRATLMPQIAKGYSDAQLAALAAYFSVQHP